MTENILRHLYSNIYGNAAWDIHFVYLKESLFMSNLPVTFEVVTRRQGPDLPMRWGPLGPCLTRVLLVRLVCGEQRLWWVKMIPGSWWSFTMLIRLVLMTLWARWRWHFVVDKEQRCGCLRPEARIRSDSQVCGSQNLGTALWLSLTRRCR